MARTRKPITLPEQLEKVSADLEAAKENVRRLKKMKKELEEKIRREQLEELDEIIRANGKSIDDVKKLLIN